MSKEFFAFVAISGVLSSLVGLLVMSMFPVLTGIFGVYSIISGTYVLIFYASPSKHKRITQKDVTWRVVEDYQRLR